MQSRTASSPLATSSVAASADALPPTPSLWRRYRGWWIALIVLLTLAVLFDFNPMHPVTWWHQQQNEFRQGRAAAARDVAARAARKRAREHQLAQPAAPASATTPAATTPQ